MKLLIMKQENVQNKVVGVQNEVVDSKDKIHQKLQNGQEFVEKNEVVAKRTNFFKKCKYVDLEL